MIQKLKFEELIQEPTKGEYYLVVKLAKENPELLDGRELWILNNFKESDFYD